MKKNLLTLFALLAVSLSAVANELTFDFSQQSYTNGQDFDGQTIDLGSAISVAWSKGTGSTTPKYYDTDTAIRLYTNNTATFSITSGNITKIVCTYSRTDGISSISSDKGTYSTENTTGTWTGSASSVTLKYTAISGHARLQKVVVTYTGGGQPEPADNVCVNTTTGTGYSYVQDAIDAAKEGDIIQLVSDVQLTKYLLVEGIGWPNPPSKGVAFTLDMNGHVLTAAAGNRIIDNYGNLTIIDSNPTATHTGDLAAYKGGILTGASVSSDYAGGAICSNTATLSIKGCTFCNNYAGLGGAIYADKTNLTLDGCLITNNTADQAAGVQINAHINTASYTTIKNCTISNNKVTNEEEGMTGGLIFDGNGTIENCTITGNEAPMCGGLYIGADEGTNYTLNFKNNTVTGNVATSLSSGVIVTEITMNLQGKNVIKGNKIGDSENNLTIWGAPCVAIDGLAAGSEIGVNIIDEEFAPCTGKFTTNGTASDLQYFTSDNTNYYVHYNTTDKCLELLEGRTYSDASVTKAQLTEAKTAGTAANVTIARTFYKDGYFNSLCLPFSLSATELANGPFAGYKALKKFVSATVEGSTLNITLEDATSIEAGVPYMISWDAAAENIVNPTFESVTITEDEAGKIEHDNADCDGTFIPTTLEKDNQNYLFLGAENTLYWPNTTNPLKGFRCYFEVKPASGAKHGMNAQFADDTTTDISQMENGKWRIENVKFIENGRVVLVKDGVRYNTSGQMLR